MRKVNICFKWCSKDQLLLAFELSFTTAVDSCRVPPPQAITTSFFGNERTQKSFLFASESKVFLQQIHKMRKVNICFKWCSKDQLLLAFELSFTTAVDSCRVPPPQAITTSFFGNERTQKSFLFASERCSASYLSGTCAWLQPVFQEPGASRLIAVDSPIRSTTRFETPSSDCTRSPDEISTIGFSTSNWPEQISGDDRRAAAAALGEEGRGGYVLGIQLAVGPQPLWLRNHNSGPTQRIMVKRLETSPHDPLGITDSACKNQSVVVSVLYSPFNPYIPIRSTTIGKSRVARDPIAMHTSWRSNSDIASVTGIGYPRMSASGESSTTMHRLLHASGSHPIPTPGDPKTNQYNQDLGLIHSTNGSHLESPKEGSSIDHQVTIYLHAQNITMFPTNETRAGISSGEKRSVQRSSADQSLAYMSRSEQMNNIWFRDQLRSVQGRTY
ncbi:hypothetical protein F511_09208 [Dorcoceras hygrometricum]|uniref:Uncharacterized protein n=1 Tax=Dorcoceras hygrometricum TaxID=472368 RepID=A0A2Z7AS67_9LAMI|nr:hypothetical protein F511_09208 [Dorcoceras hygrometricum]